MCGAAHWDLQLFLAQAAVPAGPGSPEGLPPSQGAIGGAVPCSRAPNVELLSAMRP